MAQVRPIRTQQDYEAALVRVDDLMDAELGTPEGEELDVLVDLIEHYESKRVPMGYPEPVSAIEFRMEQGGLRQRDLVPFLGSRAKVSEVLSGKRSLTMTMARALNEHLGIPAEVLLRESRPRSADAWSDIRWMRFPLHDMADRGWIPDHLHLTASPREWIQDLIRRAGGKKAAAAILDREGPQARTNAKTDPYALQAWCWQVLAKARAKCPGEPYIPGTVTIPFLQRLTRLSSAECGPRLAEDLLREHGLALVILPHLPRTHLDGAALRMGDGRPVIGLTLREDRLDTFWFSLLHELAHIGLHMDHGHGDAFVDDFSLRRIESERSSPLERQADEWADEASIPAAIWKTSVVRQRPSPLSVNSLANELHIHPAIVAGRIRFERKNNRLLPHYVGNGQVRLQFDL